MPIRKKDRIDFIVISESDTDSDKQTNKSMNKRDVIEISDTDSETKKPSKPMNKRKRVIKSSSESESESKKPIRPTNKRKRVIESSSSESESESESKKPNKPTNKRKRVIESSDSESETSDSEESDGEADQRNLEIGVIFHWGLYSVPAYDDIPSAKRRHTQNGSEWYLKRLIDTNTYRPTSGHVETKKHHKEKYGATFDYSKFVKDFKADQWDVDEWMNLCKKIGATYVIITAKHHDGFCLFDAPNAPNSVKSIGIDIVKKFKEGAKRAGLKFGIYYSWLEFKENLTVKYLQSTVIPQMKILRKYKPDILWFDGDWAMTTKFSQTTAAEICREFKKDNPLIEINDRIGNQNVDLATFRVFGDRHIPDSIPDTPWEHINTIGLSWGRNKEQTPQDYKSGRDLERLYQKVKSKHGNFLINLGPNADGTLDQNEVNSLNEWGRIIRNRNRVN